MHEAFEIEPIGTVESELSELGDAPLQADEGAPPAWLSLCDSVAGGLDGSAACSGRGLRIAPTRSGSTAPQFSSSRLRA